MPSKNIFGGQSARALFAHYVYEELRKREFVTLVDVLCIYNKRDKSYYDLHTYSSDKAPNVERADKGSYKETDGTIHRRITKI